MNTTKPNHNPNPNPGPNPNPKPGPGQDRDPLGLSRLKPPSPEPGRAAQDWQVVAGALQADRNRRRAWLGGLAAAASVALVITLLALPRTDEAISTGHELAGEQPAAVAQPDVAAAQPGSEELMAMSLEMERQLRFLRSQVGSMPSEMVVYQVELQDLIGQVDDALSLNPDSDALWGQRLGLQMNLVKLYRGQLRRDYAHMASL